MLHSCCAGPLQADFDEQALQTDTVWWAAPTSVLVSSTAYEGEVCPDPYQTCCLHFAVLRHQKALKCVLKLHNNQYIYYPLLGQEALDLAPLHMLHWSRWDAGAAPEDLSLSSFWPNTIEVRGSACTGGSAELSCLADALHAAIVFVYISDRRVKSWKCSL